LSVPECDLGIIEVIVEAGMEGQRQRAEKKPRMKADVGVADEVKAKQ
jgi:hypothetical protein